MTLEQVMRLDAGSWKSEQFKGVKIPTFAEALEVMPFDIWVNVHLKGDAELGKKVAEEIVKSNRQHQAFVACEKDAEAAARKVSADIMICNMERQSTTAYYVSLTIADKSDFIQLYKIPINDEMLNNISPLKDNSIKINYCCTDSPEEVKKLLEYGVDFVLVNEPAKVLQAIGSLDAIRPK